MTAIAHTIDRFVASFNEQDLDRTMSFFADHAEYLPGDGTTHRGPTEIRAAFAPMLVRPGHACDPRPPASFSQFPIASLRVAVELAIGHWKTGRSSPPATAAA
jgi:hypothetical protein